MESPYPLADDLFFLQAEGAFLELLKQVTGPDHEER